MSEITFITAAKRHRSLIETQYRLDRQHAEAVKLREGSFTDAKRDSQLITKKIESNEQRMRLRRTDMKLDAESKLALADQQRAKSTISSDFRFKQTRKAMGDELFSSRYERETNEVRLLRHLEADRAEMAELKTLEQRDKDTQKAIIEWETRISERRIAERDADILAKINLQLAIVRIRDIDDHYLESENAMPGKIVDLRS